MLEWQEVSSRVGQRSDLDPVLFNVLIIYYCAYYYLFGCQNRDIFLTKFAGKECAHTLEDKRIQKDVDDLVSQAKGNRMKFTTKKCKVLYLGKNNQKAHMKMGEKRLDGSHVEKDP